MRHSPQRSCVGCRTVREKQELVRVVRTLESQFRLDLTGKQAGRGAYVCPSGECLALALKRKSFDRSFRQSVSREELTVVEQQIREHLSGAAPQPDRNPPGPAE